MSRSTKILEEILHKQSELLLRDVSNLENYHKVAMCGEPLWFKDIEERVKTMKCLYIEYFVMKEVELEKERLGK